MKLIVTTIGSLVLASALSLAQDKPAAPGGPGGPGGAPGGPGGPGGPGRGRMNPEEIFKKLDTNNDGSLSLDEFKAGRMAQRDPSKAEEMFKKIDTDSDGKVTLEEFKAFRPQRGPRGGEGKPPGPPPTEAPATK